MSASNELIENWNASFDNKISEEDLRKPQHLFLFNALKCYLRNININIDRVEATQLLTRSEQNFKFNFCKYIDHLYKTSDKSNNFYYSDLIQPLPRKTIHLLTTLLNFYFYFKMIKDDVTTTAQSALKDHDQIIAARNQFHIDNEKAKSQGKEIENDIKHMDSKLRSSKNKRDNLVTKKENYVTQISELKANIKYFDTMNCNLRLEKIELEEQIIPESNVKHVEQSLKAAEEELKYLEEIRQKKSNNNKECAEKMRHLELAIDKKKELHKPEILKEIEEVKELSTNLKNLKNRQKEILTESDKMAAHNLVLEQTVSALEKSLEEKLKLRTEIENDPKIVKLEALMSKELKNQNVLLKKIEETETEKSELTLMQDFVVTNGIEILKEML